MLNSNNQTLRRNKVEYNLDTVVTKTNTVYYENYGCASNKSDMEIMLGILGNNGYSITQDPKTASLIIVNTCAVKQITEDKIFGKLNKMKNHSKPIIITGCLPKINLQRIADSHLDHCSLLDPASIDKIDDIANKCLQNRVQNIIFSNRPPNKPSLPRRRLNSYIEILQISEGCQGKCSYCCTRFARGRLHCFTPKSILKQIQKAIAENSVEIQLTAQDTASYNYRGYNLCDLLRDISAIKGDFKIRIGMMNPETTFKLLDDIIHAYENDKIYKYLHVPIQSGSNRILKLMKRKNTIDDFLSIVSIFRSHFPTISIATDIIVGFPTETQEDFEETLNLIKLVRPDVINISKYTPRPGTAASKMKQLDSRIIASRSRILSKQVGHIIKTQHMKMLGSYEEVYPIERTSTGTLFCRTHNYKKAFIQDVVPMGKKIRVKIIGAHQRRLDCKVLDPKAPQNS
ncbi:tRNA (N(6)-L-threonylcarbamoyladenosine(37)-C(2))-methylthiotransferase [Candidatus Bathyarchaeota archaeon]|nr:tRNA (N(6)-L-threonylcarbamoyladenosine(37)-C(2))-methylthiotransferase [Candidatus Bathyarchaeota archaeon]